METDPRISIILLNWNGYKDTVECVASLHKLTYKNFNIIIADNGSKGEDLKLLRQSYQNTNIIILDNKKNYGFAEGNNIAIRYALNNGADFCLLLNNDTVVREDLLEKMLIGYKKGYQVIGGKINYYYQKNKIWFGGGMINKYLGIPLDAKEKNIEQEVDFVSGCMMLVHKDVFNKIGFLNKEYFAYWEDIEFCFRAKKNNYKVYYVPDTVCYHKVSASAKKGNLQTYYEVRNRFRFLDSHFFLPYILSAYLFYFFISLPIHIIKNVFSLKFSNIYYEFRAIFRSNFR
jgi:hypothetical protein